MSIWLVFLGTHLWSQEFEASRKSDTSIGIGEPVEIDIVFRTDVNDPDPEFPILRRGKILGDNIELSYISEPIIEHGPAVTEIKLIAHVILWDSGIYSIPAFSAFFKNDSIYTNTLTLTVSGIDVNLEAKPKDIYKIFDANWTIWDQMLYWVKHNWYWLLIGLLLLLALIMLPGSIRKRRLKQPVVQRKIPTVPYVLQELDRIEQESQWKKGQVKTYYSELTETIWLYLEEQFEVPTLDQTSDQIMQNLSSVKLAPKMKQKLRELFKIADMVKFAKAIPDDTVNQNMLNYSRDFVEGTKDYNKKAPSEA